MIRIQQAINKKTTVVILMVAEMIAKSSPIEQSKAENGFLPPEP
jgi:hypothetical protein